MIRNMFDCLTLCVFFIFYAPTRSGTYRRERILHTVTNKLNALFLFQDSLKRICDIVVLD